MLTETEMSYEDMKEAVDNGYLCAKCQGCLTVAWGGSLGIKGYILRCGQDINHSGITRHDKKYEQKLKEGFSMESKTLMTMDEAKMLKRIEMARFPQDLTVPEKKLLAQVAITYGFDPLMGEVSIYQGRPYVSIDGRYRKAQETGNLDGVESRPATKQERIDWQIPEGDYFFRADVHLKGATRPFIGWGRVFQIETVGGKGFKPIEKNPQRMAEKRAEAQALRKGFHIPLPSVEDIGSPDYDVESTAIEVDTTTGEIKEPKPKGKKAKLAPKPEQPPQATSVKTEAVAEETYTAGGIQLDWLRESIATLQKKEVKGWLDDALLSYMKTYYKVEADDPIEAANRLNKNQSVHFTKQIQDALERTSKLI